MWLARFPCSSPLLQWPPRCDQPFWNPCWCVPHVRFVAGCAKSSAGSSQYCCTLRNKLWLEELQDIPNLYFLLFGLDQPKQCQQHGKSLPFGFFSCHFWASVLSPYRVTQALQRLFVTFRRSWEVGIALLFVVWPAKFCVEVCMWFATAIHEADHGTSKHWRLPVNVSQLRFSVVSILWLNITYILVTIYHSKLYFVSAKFFADWTTSSPNMIIICQSVASWQDSGKICCTQGITVMGETVKCLNCNFRSLPWALPIFVFTECSGIRSQASQLCQRHAPHKLHSQPIKMSVHSDSWSYV